VQRRDDVEVLLAALVVEQRALLEQLGDEPGVDDGDAASRRVAADELERIEGDPGVAAGIAGDAIARYASVTACGGVSRPRPRSASRQARCRISAIAVSSSGCSTKTFERDKRAAFTSNDGFSVVAPTRTRSPASTRGRKASCCALLKRWISSTKSIVRRPSRRRVSSASAITALISLMPEVTAL
jgi:hypothetical protein